MDAGSSPGLATYDPGTTETSQGSTTGDGSICAVDGIGWIICPLANSIATGIDGIFDLLKQFLEAAPLSTNTTSGLFQAWATFRDIGNVGFVIVFLVVIYSQITAAGISNYGIKKMLPRIMIGAVLVNASYWICAVGVDLSNILGVSLESLLMSLRNAAVSSSAANIPTWNIVTTSILVGSVAGLGAFAAAAAAGFSAAALLWALVPAMLIALLSIVVALAVLAARQALIIVLIVVSPLAFVAYLLPNTQQWFERWRTLLTTMLVVFPMVALLFGGSQLAASIIMNNATSMLTVLLALCIQVMPLALTPFLIKFSNGVLG